MAYRGNYNPDALTVSHAEPDERPQDRRDHHRRDDRDRRDSDRERLERLQRDRDRLEREQRERDRVERERRRADKPAPPLPNEYDYGGSSSSRYGAAPPPGPSRNPYGAGPSGGGPGGYGYGTGPVNSGRPTDHGRTPNPQYRPPTVPPVAPRDGNDRDALWPMFRSVDKDGEWP
jgi:hypothetical protein